jgi:cysteinyl-tRNA synthetase
MALRVYNTLSRRKEEFVPLHEGEVRMYVCGPNVYGPSHVGHAMSYLVFDVIRRYLEYRGYRVVHVQNFTDIEDRIIETARAQGTTIEALAEQYIARFLREMDALGVQRATHYPRATREIPRMIAIIRALEERGLAYQRDGDVFFRVTAFPRYGRLSGRSLEEMQAGARIEVDPRKEHPMDFVLWKAAKPGEPAWHSPWGPGRPGWHIECSAMSIAYLGEQLDIHGGGQDVIFPHHENEIAQSEGYTGRVPFVRYWVHNGLLRPAEGEEKMTRHLGNMITIQEALERYHPDTIRVFVLSSHYRNPTTWSEEALRAAARGAERLRIAVETAEEVLATARDGSPQSPSGLREGEEVLAGAREARGRFEAAMDDDFNTPVALAALFDLATLLNRATDAAARARGPLPGSASQALDVARRTLRELAGILGLRLEARATAAQVSGLRQLAEALSRERPDLFAPEDLQTILAAASAGPDGAELEAQAERLIDFIGRGRLEARRKKDWATGDRIRARLQDLGVSLEDTPTGFKWRLRWTP